MLVLLAHLLLRLLLLPPPPPPPLLLLLLLLAYSLTNLLIHQPSIAALLVLVFANNTIGIAITITSCTNYTLLCYLRLLLLLPLYTSVHFYYY